MPVPIVFGQKTTRHLDGIVADYCRFCRAIRACDLVRLGRALHLYGMSGAGDLLGHEAYCRTCGRKRRVDRSAFKGLAKNDEDLDAVIQAAQLDIRERHKKRIERDERVADGSLSEQERGEVIRDCLDLVNPILDARAAVVHFDRLAAVGFAIFLVGPFVVAVGAGLLGAPGTLCAALLLACAAGGLALVIYAGATDVQRFTRREVLPLLVQLLGPMKPRRDELDRALDEACARDQEVGERIELSRLMPMLERE